MIRFSYSFLIYLDAEHVSAIIVENTEVNIVYIVNCYSSSHNLADRSSSHKYDDRYQLT